MANKYFVLFAVSLGILFGCSPKKESASESPSSIKQTAQIRDTGPMRADFMESCISRPEYSARKRNGTLSTHCACIFDTTMKGLSVNEQVLAGFYLYGEKNEAFLSRYALTAQDLQAMSVVVQAIGKAQTSCR